MAYFDIDAYITQNLTKRSIESYDPHEKQKRFHRSLHKAKLYIGGNRSGKTVGGIVEDIWRLKGEHPYRKVPPAPVYGRLVTTDFDDGYKKVIEPEFKKWIPLSLLKNGSWDDSYSKQLKMLTLTNGSTMEFMTHMQKTADFSGASRHFIHFDEEPPKDIFSECKARLIDTGGSYYITMTPVEGVTWVHDDLWEPNHELNPDQQKVLVIQVDMTENPYLAQEEIDFYLEGLDDNERKARKEGKFVPLTNLILSMFNTGIHVIPEKIPPRTWRLIESMDSGINHPTAWTWTAVSPNNVCVTFKEHKMSDWTIEKHANRVFEIRKEIGNWRPNLITGDPAIRQRSVETGYSIQIAYRKLGIGIKPPVNRDFETGISRMQSYLTHGPRWYITENCTQLIREIKKYRWDKWQNKRLQERNAPKRVPHKVDDDLIDTVRYFMNFMPNLNPRLIDKSLPDAALFAAATLLDTPKGRTRYMTTHDIRRMNPQKTNWKAVDQNYG